MSIRIGKGWAKSQHFTTGQCPVVRCNKQLMHAILSDRAPIAKNVNAKLISLDKAPEGYKNFDRGASVKYILDPHGLAAKMLQALPSSSKTISRKGATAQRKR